MTCKAFMCEHRADCPDSYCESHPFNRPPVSMDEVETWYERTLIFIGAVSFVAFFWFAYYAAPILR